MAQGKIIGVLPVRLQSKRLPRKHLQMADGKTLLEWSLLRYFHWARYYELDMEFVVATTPEPGNEVLREVCAKTGARFFVGDQSNIPNRLLQAAEAFDAEGVVSIDGDDIACSPMAIAMVAALLRLSIPYVSTKGLPLGMNAAGYLRSELITCLQASSSKVLETGWGRIFGTPTLVEPNLKFSKMDAETSAKLRLTLDYEQDLAFFQKMILALKGQFVTSDDEAIVETIVSLKLYNINGSLGEEYWRNFRAELAKESSVE